MPPKATFSRQGITEVVSELVDVREEYRRLGWVFLPGDRVLDWLTTLGVGREEIASLPGYWEDLRPDPTLGFRRSRNGRFWSDPARKVVYRGVDQPFVLTDGEDFVRHDSGRKRVFASLDAGFSHGAAVRGLLAIKDFLIRGEVPVHRPNLDYTDPRSVTTAFALRTVTDAGRQGHPALEGVHADGVDHTMTTLIAAANMTPLSAVTFLHDNAERTGIPWQEARERYVRGQVRHRGFLDTLLVRDASFKHSLTPVTAEDPHTRATRDMLILFTRKPAAEPHPSAALDSADPMPGHRTSPLLPEPQPGVIDVADFLRPDIRVGRVLTAGPLPKARVPAYAMTVDFGALGVRTTSARITDRYAAEDLPGRHVLAVVNLPERRVAGIDSQVLVLGLADDAGRDVILVGPDPGAEVPLGRRLT